MGAARGRAGQSSPTTRPRPTPGAPLSTSTPPADQGRQDLLAQRYGRRPSGTSRRALGTAFAVFAAAVLALAGWVGYDRWTSSVQWSAVAFSVVDDGVTRVTFDVVLPQGRSAVCAVRARNVSFAEVGRVDQQAGPFAGGSGRVTVDVPTTERAINGDVPSCVLR